MRSILTKAQPMRRTVWKAIEWLGSHELIMLVGLMVPVLGVWGFIELAEVVGRGKTQHVDEAILRALRRADNPARPIGPAWMGDVGRDITALGGVAVTVLVTLAAAGFLAISRKFAAMAYLLA